MQTILPGLRSGVNLHPMVVHFPIAFWVAASVVWGLALARNNASAWRFGLWLHAAGASMALVAVAAGYLATSLLGHDSPGHSFVHVHRDIMLGATALSLLVTTLAWWRRNAGKAWRAGLMILSVLQVLIMILGADRGAFLVYQMRVGVEMPAPSAPKTHNQESMETHK